MKQGGYLLISAIAIAFFIAVLTLIFLDATRTRRERKLADMLLRQAQVRVFEDQATANKDAAPSNIDAIRILHDLIFRGENLDSTEQLARAIHSSYVATEGANSGRTAADQLMVPWESLPESLRQSSIAEAADIRAELKEIGAIVVRESPSAPPFAFTDQEIEHLARLEHQRWMRARLATGWKFGQPRDLHSKIHPDLSDWDDLSESSKNKGRDVIRTLPETLHAAGYQILRLPSDLSLRR